MSDKHDQKINIVEPESALELHIDAMMDIEHGLANPPVLPVPSAPLFEPLIEQPVTAAATTPINSDSTPIIPLSEQPIEQTIDPPSDGASTAVQVGQAGVAVEKSTVPKIADDPAADATIVDDISVHESDELLAARDARQTMLTNARDSTLGSRSLTSGRTGFFAAWAHSRIARYGTLLVVIAGLGSVGMMPTSRYYALNVAGVRSAASLTILDNSTQQPLKNVSVELGTIKTRSNRDGVIKLHDLQLGIQSLTVSQPGFATITKTVTLGLGSNPLGDFTLDPVGAQFRFKAVDYLSG